MRLVGAGGEERGVDLHGARPVGGILAGAVEGNADSSPGEQRSPLAGADQLRALVAGSPAADEVLYQ
jgi:hypothetical protein